MKSKILIFSLLALTLVLAGCGKQDKVTVGSVAKTYNAAQDLNQDMNDPSKIASDANVENIYTLMNYGGNESKENVKKAIKEGIEAGKKQDELNKEVVTNIDLGTAYMLGYVFGCKAVTGDEAKCNTDMGAKFQVIMMGELQKQMPVAQ